jgi:hypothetical protein
LEDAPTRCFLRVGIVLSPISFNFTDAFRLLAKEDVTVTYAISQNIQLRDWRLEVQIIIETERKYSAAKPEKTTNKTSGNFASVN